MVFLHDLAHDYPQPPLLIEEFVREVRVVTNGGKYGVIKYIHSKSRWPYEVLYDGECITHIHTANELTLA